ncbi:MAG: hypothetical protein M0P66_01455 [Salinivirgaceae bacterium]|nr:hypothetical protein [Salinivirgaceae bacterium]
MKNSKATTYDQLNDSILSMMSKMPFAYTQAEDFLSGQILFKQDSNFTAITQDNWTGPGKMLKKRPYIRVRFYWAGIFL